MQNQDNINAYIRQALVDNWERLALTDFQGVSYQYRDVARKIVKLHILFEQAGVRPGDKIALCGRNCSQWAVALLASLTYGSVAVPILHDFKPDNIHHLVAHSDARLLFTDEHTWENLDTALMPCLEGVVLIKDYSLLYAKRASLTKARENLNRLFGERYPERFTAGELKFYEPRPEGLALINYTSGSTGFSKGVMLTYDNLWSNLQFCIDGLTFLHPGDNMICMLPLAHMYGLMVELLHTFVKGCHIYFLTRTPSPKVIMDAFAEVRPKLIVAVPLILEKIVKTRIFPVLDKPLMKFLLHLPYVDDKVLGKVRDKMTAVFGGNLHEMIIGGAGLNKDVESFLRRIRFPYTVGYGMTECGPLITYSPWDVQRPGSCGCPAPRIECRIDSADPEHVPGVLWVRGRNVMKGYYKNPEATDSVFDKDGWMNTGDICQRDPDGFIYIRGRDKNMILGPSGQNIYPEEIEQQLNNLPYVGESLVVSRDGGRLVALVYPDMDAVSREGIGEERLRSIMDENLKTLNAALPAYSQLSEVKINHEEFEKTPKRSIKRYLYN